MSTARTQKSPAFEAPIPSTAYPFGGFAAQILLGVRLPERVSKERNGTA